MWRCRLFGHKWVTQLCHGIVDKGSRAGTVRKCSRCWHLDWDTFEPFAGGYNEAEAEFRKRLSA